MTIADAAEQSIKSLGKPSTAKEIHTEIVRLDLYQFNTPNPVHVLEIQLKRHSADSQRTDKMTKGRFTINSDNTYSIKMKRAQTIGMKRILRASDKEELIEELISNRVGLFKEIWRLLLFAAQVGLQAKKREALRAVETGKGIDQATFGNSSSWPGILYLMSLVEVGDSQMLDGSSEGEDQRVLLFQEYANGGLSIMRDFFKDRTIDLDGVLAFIQSSQGQNATLDSPDLDLTI
jgi:dnd system-associated protein 4